MERSFWISSEKSTSDVWYEISYLQLSFKSPLRPIEYVTFWYFVAYVLGPPSTFLFKLLTGAM